MGVAVWKSDAGRLDLLGGGAYNRESFTPEPPQLAFSRNSGKRTSVMSSRISSPR